MLAFLVDAAYLVGGLLGILLLLLPFLGLLAVCVIYLMFDIIEGFRKRRGLPLKVASAGTAFSAVPDFLFHLSMLHCSCEWGNEYGDATGSGQSESGPGYSRCPPGWLS